MTTAQNLLNTAVSAVTKVKTVEDVLAPHTKVVSDLTALIEQREDLINKARVKRELLTNQIAALDGAIKAHNAEIADADAVRAKFRELVG